MDITHIQEWCRSSQTVVDRVEGQFEQNQISIDQLIAKIEDARVKQELLQIVGAYLTTFGETAQLNTQKKIEALVTHGLRTVFGEDLTFHLVPGTRGNQATLDFHISSPADGQDVTTDVLDARGGGVASVVGFLLRLVVLLLSSGSKFMVLDETFAQVSEEYEGRVAEFMRELVDKTKVQIVLITHSQAYTDVADKAYRFRLVDGLTKVESLA